MSKISVVVPLRDEEGNVRELHERLLGVFKKINYDFEIIFVDDGSSDATYQIAKELSPIKAVRLCRNYGQSTAFGVGFELAQGDVILTIDGDLENAPEDIPAFIEKLNEGYDLVSGWRKNRWRGKLISRYIPSYIANKLISIISGAKLNDHGCMVKAYRREVLKNINMTGERHRMVAAFVALEGGKIAEIPITFHKRKFGKSKYGIARTFKVLLDLLAFYFFKRYASRPIHFFGGAGFISFFAGFLIFLWATYLKIFAGVHYNRSPLMILVAIFAVIGSQFILMGLLAEILSGNHRSDNKSKAHLIKEIAEK